MHGSRGGALRTNLAVLAVSAGQALTGAYFVVYGSPPTLQGPVASSHPLWMAYVMALGFGGVLLFIAKGIVRPRWLRLSLGAFGILPLLATAFNAARFSIAAGFVYAAVASVAMLYALWNEEPEPVETPRMLLVLVSGALLLLTPLAFLVLREGPPPAAPMPFMFAAAALGAFALWAHARRPGTTYDLTARYAMAASFAVLAIGAYAVGTPLMAIVYAIFSVLLAAADGFKRYRLGLDDARGGLSEEALVVRQFEVLAEMLAWSTFVFAYVHMLYQPGVIAIRGALFALFVGAFGVFSIQYRLFRPERLNFRHLYRSSMLNAALLAVICHYTGGISSPYNWFFVFILMSGSIAPQPVRILHRLGVILVYYAVETAYFAVNGFLTRDLVVNHLMIEVFVLGLTGMYSYHLSLRRQRIDDDLMSANARIKEALEHETAAKTLIAKQALDIALARKRDEALLASLADAVIGFDAQGRIVSLNPAGEGLLGLTQADVRGKRLRDLVDLRCEDDPSFRLGSYMDTALNGNAVPLPENTYIVKEKGARVFLTGTVLPLLDDDKKVSGIVMTLSDVTYTREVDQMKTSFLSVAAHQLRTPLSTIRWYLELLNDPSEGKLRKNQKMFAENAYLSLRKMVGLVNRLLAVTRLEAGRVPFKPEPTDLKALTQEILESLRHRTEEHALVVRAAIPDLDAVQLDPTLAREVFRNLIENAIRYTPDGGNISISAKDEGKMLSWTIADTGIGIPKTQQAKIFEKFFRAGNAIEHSSEGSGLGLYLARFIVNAWGGEIGFSSEEGKGTEFRVTVPKSGMHAKVGNVSLNA